MKLVRSHLELEEQKARKRSDSTRKPLLELLDFAGESPLSKGVIDRVHEVTLRPDPATDGVMEIHSNEVEDVIEKAVGSEPTARHRNPLTVRAPAAQDFSFAPLFDDPSSMLAIENAIAEGAYAEAVYRAASAVSEVLDAVLGPYGGEGYGARALLLGLDGREYLELRKVASRAASAVTQNDALFAVYFLLAVRFRERRLTRF